eukprot:tig00020944_g16367.t1
MDASAFSVASVSSVGARQSPYFGTASLRRPARSLRENKAGSSTQFKAEATPAADAKDRKAPAAGRATFAKASFAALIAAAGLGMASANVNAAPLTYEQMQSANYLKIKGTGQANTCATLPSEARGAIQLDSSKSYYITDMCLQPTEVQVKAESLVKGQDADYQPTRLLTRSTYTIDKVEGPIVVSNDGTVTFEEKDGFDYQALTVKLPGGEMVPMLFTIKDLVATGNTPKTISVATKFAGDFTVPSYRMGNFQDPKSRGFAVGEDYAHGLPAADQDVYAKENIKQQITRSGSISLQVTRVNAQTGEIGGVWTSEQPGDDDMGSKEPKPVRLSGLFFAKLNEGSNPADFQAAGAAGTEPSREDVDAGAQKRGAGAADREGAGAPESAPSPQPKLKGCEADANPFAAREEDMPSDAEMAVEMAEGEARDAGEARRRHDATDADL